MSNITASFYALAKSNNGMFKSDKQAAFLLAQCEGNVYFRVVADTFGDDAKKTNYSELTITCDSIGVVSIVKVGQKSGKTNVQFQRVSAAEYAAKQAAKAAEMAAEDKRIAAGKVINDKRAFYDAMIAKYDYKSLRAERRQNNPTLAAIYEAQAERYVTKLGNLA